MDQGTAIGTMADNLRRLRNLAEGVSVSNARWRPGPEDWSLLEVMCHLLDEERLDFRVRLEIILFRPSEPWPAIDPQGWVLAREYNRQDLPVVLKQFAKEREMSLGWLRGLESPDWNRVYEAPFGPIRAGDMLAAWVAHDLLHMRQLVEWHWAHTEQALTPYRVQYAGSW